MKMPKRTIEISLATKDLIKKMQDLDPEFNFSGYTDAILRDKLTELVEELRKGPKIKKVDKKKIKKL